ncbi:hypothetical protein [Streptomyces sp. NPDC056061]|uniref:hypothetical protein n=1 Tax=Streptomyces sp. NPDC056061 TaxID=3345700 RepID=UPI0035DE8E7E
MDLLDVYRGHLSLRKLRVLIDRLPPESATKTAIRNSISDDELQKASSDYRPDKAPWSSVEILLASIKDEITLSRGAAIAIAGGKPVEFHPTPRPGIPPKSVTRRGMTDEQRRAIDPRLRDQT